MEDEDFEWNNICNETNELYADILSEGENDTDESDDSDFPINIKRKVLPIVSDSETSNSDGTEFDNEENNSTTHWSGNDVKLFPRNPENTADTLDLLPMVFVKLLVEEIGIICKICINIKDHAQNVHNLVPDQIG
ncbi:hypothetical protein FQA39_LY18277 [Lamprigera yunnana]|nr:hypothetical protein FQA39_LY18277 [Lamprigera yunnana]